MRVVKWKQVGSSDADRCDECNQPFKGGETRILGEDKDHSQFIIHMACKLRWEKRTGSVDAETAR